MESTTIFTISNDTPTTPITFINCTKPVLCMEIIMKQFGKTPIRVLDITVLVPMILFILFLLFNASTVIRRLLVTNSTIMTTLYAVIWIQAILISVRCVVCILLDSFVGHMILLDKILWLIVRFVTLFVEMAVVVFGLGAAHLDSQTSVRRCVLVTSLVALCYSLIQSMCEFLPSSHGRVQFLLPHNRRPFNPVELYQHGGSLFFFASSFLFFLTYVGILLLPLTNLAQKYAIPSKTRFYVYCSLLAFVNMLQAVGSLLYFQHILEGFCVVTLATSLYFIGLNPLVYFIFLWPNLGASSSVLNQYVYLDDEPSPAVDPAPGRSPDVPDTSVISSRASLARSIASQPSELSLRSALGSQMDRPTTGHSQRNLRRGSLHQLLSSRTPSTRQNVGDVMNFHRTSDSVVSICEGDAAANSISITSKDDEEGQWTGWDMAATEGIPEFVSGRSSRGWHSNKQSRRQSQSWTSAEGKKQSRGQP